MIDDYSLYLLSTQHVAELHDRARTDRLARTVSPPRGPGLRAALRAWPARLVQAAHLRQHTAPS